MKILSTMIEGLGPYLQEFTINWAADYPGVVALTGRKGAGKTFLLSAPFAALYGRFPGRPGSLYDHMSPGVRKARVRVIFEVAEKVYEALRVIELSEAGRTKQVATLTRLSGTGKDCAFEIIGGPNQGDFLRAIENLIGPEIVAASTWFAGQKAVGDLCALDERDRRIIFGKFLGFERLDALSKKFRELAREEETQIKLLTDQLAGMTDTDHEIELVNVRARLVMTLEEIERLKKEDVSLDLLELGAKTKQADALGRASAVETAAKGVAQFERDLHVCDQRHEEYVAHRDRLQASIDEKPRAEQGMREHAETMAAMLDEQAKVAGYESARALNASIEAARRELGELKRQEESLADLPAPTADDLRLVDGHDAIVESLNDFDSKGLEIHRENLERTRSHTEKEAAVAAGRRSVFDLEHAYANKPDTPAPDDVCAQCQFMKDWSAIPARISEEERLLQSNMKLDDKPLLAAQNGAERQRIMTDIQAGSEAIAKCAAHYGVAKKTDALKELIEAQEETVESLPPKVIDLVDPAPEIARLTVHLVGLAPCVETLRAAEKAEEEIELVMGRINRRRSEANSINQVLRAAKEVLSDQQKALKQGEPLDALRRLADEISVKIKRNAQLLELAVERKGSLEAAAEHEEKAVSEVKQKRDTVEALKKSLGNNRWLQRCFGPKGIQAIMIDQAVERLEHYADWLIKMLVNENATLSIRTQDYGRQVAGNADPGEASEAFKIVISTAEMEKDISCFSGGEQRMWMTILRIAIALWQGELRGHRPQTLFLDEAFDALDSEQSAGEMADMIAKLGEHFEQIVVITHSPEIADRMPRRVVLEKDFGRVRIAA